MLARKRYVSIVIIGSLVSGLVGSNALHVMAASPLKSASSTAADTNISQTNISQTDIPQMSFDSKEALVSVRSRLTNLEALPLFLPAEQGTLESADSQLSATQLSRPSFSWIRDQVAVRYGSTAIPTEIVNQWQTYTTNEGFKYVDVVVNESIWERLNYLRRYGFVVQFGTVAQDYGYQLRIFHTGDVTNRQDALSLATRMDPGNSAVVGRSVRLRGAYFCAPSAGLLPTCGTFVAP